MTPTLPDRPNEPGWLADLRRQGLARFEALGVPTKRHEDWRYTSLRAVADTAWTSESGGVAAEIPDLPGACARVVLVDGALDLAASDLSGLPEGVRVLPFDEAHELVRERLGRAAHAQERAMVALNQALMTGGVVVHAAPGARTRGPIHLVWLSTPAAQPRAVHVRNLVIAERTSELELVERWVGGEGSVWNDVVTEVFTGPGARVHHVEIQSEGPGAVHLGSLDVVQERDSAFVSHRLSVGGQLARTEVHAALDAEGADCALYALWLGRGDQQHDALTFVDHKRPHGRSHQVLKGILDDRAQGVFNGLVVVREGADKTDAVQSNKNLVLSDDAEAHTRPQLEIHADDVKCAHGATVGALDPESLFFLRARGLGEREARAMLTRSFAHDVMETLPAGSPVRAELERIVDGWLE